MVSPSSTLPVVRMELPSFPPLPPPTRHFPPPPPPPEPPLNIRTFHLLPPPHKRLLHRLTSNSSNLPSAHYLDSLLVLLHSPGPSFAERQTTCILIARDLALRLTHNSVYVQIKANLLLHALLRHAPYPPRATLAQAVHDAVEERDLKGVAGIRAFVVSYHAYVMRRAAMAGRWRMEEHWAEMELKQVMDMVVAWMGVVDALVDVKMDGTDDDELPRAAITMMKMDLEVCREVLGEGVGSVVKVFKTMNAEEKKSAWRVVLAYVALQCRVKRFGVAVKQIRTDCPGGWARLRPMHADVMRKMLKEMNQEQNESYKQEVPGG